MKIYLYYIYFAIGFVLSFPIIAIQFTIMDISSPVQTGIAYGCMTIPWCLKPIFGYISDKYSIFNWGNRKPYIFFSSLISSFLYVNVYDYKNNFILFIFLLTILSACTCFIDVCADCIPVQFVKYELESGVTQSNTWLSRAFGTLIGFILGGILYKISNAQNVLTFCAYIPLITCFVVWKIREIKYKSPLLKDVWKNLVEEKTFICILFMFHISPNYRIFYEYFLKEKLNYSPDDFTYLSIISTLSFVMGLISFKFYFRKIKIKKLIWNAIVVSSILRLTQIGVVLNIFPYFEIVMFDGIIESFCGQLIMMPLIVLAAKRCHEGLEGSFFSFIMSVMNFGVFLGDEVGAFIANVLNVNKNNFEYLYVLMLIAIVTDVLIAYITVQKMSFYFEDYVSISKTDVESSDHLNLNKEQKNDFDDYEG